ncbi:MAG: Hsp20 family protein [Rhodobacterales bacterium]|nr:Hsp20 family protein [Rhodobacterales bacterium]
MRTFDLTPLYRMSVGYDHLNRLFDMVSKYDDTDGPSYDIVKTGEDSYRIAMAVPGFTKDEIAITTERNALKISAKKTETTEDTGDTYLHRGITVRSFERSFDLADHVRVDHASLEDGILRIDLARQVPEHMKPRTIAIEAPPADAAKPLEDKTAA